MVPTLDLNGKATSDRVRFVREFASAQDVKRKREHPEHPALDRTLDIIAGPKPVAIPVDVLQIPYAVTTDSGHRVFVTDVGARKVHVFDFGRLKYFVLEDGSDRLRQPMGVAADPAGNVYVTDASAGAILVYDAKGKFRHYLRNASESYFESPIGIAVDAATEHVYVCDSPRHMVIVLDKMGHILDRFGKRGGGTEPGEFRFPMQVVAAGGEIFILDSENRRVQILDVQGRFRREIKLDHADYRTGLAVDNDANIYVSDVNRVQVFNHEGRLLYEFGQRGKKAGEFDGASGLWVDSGHCLYVVDALNKRVQAFPIHGTSTNDCQ